MAVIETKYSVGDIVYFARTTTEGRQHPCPDCKGTRKWKAVSPAGEEYEFACPRCSARFNSYDELRLDYTAHTPVAERLTIGSVRHDSNGSHPDYAPKNEYMCRETGVGSGNVYREDRLFPTENEALLAAELLAAEANANTEWIVKRYDRALEISDYKLSNALIKEAKDARYRASAMLSNLSYLFEQIEGAEDKDAILEVVEDYKRFDWRRDELKARGIEAGTDETAQQAQPEGRELGPEDAPQ